MLCASQLPCLPPWQVSDKSLAAVFYGEGLGLTADPGSTAAQRGGVGVTWYNIGRQQVSNLSNFCTLYLLIFICTVSCIFLYV